MYHTLIHCFEGSIMHTYMSRFSQFLIFYTCSLDPSRFARNFMEHLIHLVTSFDQVRKKNTAKVVCSSGGTIVVKAGEASSCEQDHFTRRIAAGYLASFMARAKFLSPSALIDGLEKICSFCVGYINQREAPSCLVRLTEQIIMLANGSSGQDILGIVYGDFFFFFFFF